MKYTKMNAKVIINRKKYAHIWLIRIITKDTENPEQLRFIGRFRWYCCEKSIFMYKSNRKSLKYSFSYKIVWKIFLNYPVLRMILNLIYTSIHLKKPGVYICDFLNNSNLFRWNIVQNNIFQFFSLPVCLK